MEDVNKYFLAGAKRIELLSSELEADVFPLHQTRKLFIFGAEYQIRTDTFWLEAKCATVYTNSATMAES